MSIQDATTNRGRYQLCHGLTYRHPCLFKLAVIPRDDRETVFKGSRCDQEVGLRISIARSPAFMNEQPPTEHHVLRYRQYPSREHRPYLTRKPFVQLIAASVPVCKQLDAKAQFGQGNDADMQLSSG